MNFFFLVVDIVLIIYQVGYVRPKPRSSPPCAIGQQPPSQQLPPVPVQQQALPRKPPNKGQQLQQQHVPPQWPPQPCNALQQPPFNPQNQNHLRQQGMLQQQTYPQPSGYSSPPVVYPGGSYPPVPGAYPGVHPVNSAGCCYPISSPSEIIPPVDKRRSLVWCTCTTCKEVVPILLKGNRTQTASFGKHKYPNGEPKISFSMRTDICERPKVRIELRKHRNPANAVRKVFMLFY